MKENQIFWAILPKESVFRPPIVMDDGHGLVIARYSSEAAMKAATRYNKEAFGELVMADAVDGSSISSRSGEKVFSF